MLISTLILFSLMSNSNIPKKAIFTIAVIAATLGMMIGMTTVSNIQTAVADQGGVPNDNANPVAKSPGATSNKEFFQTCKEFINTPSECAHDPTYGPGEFTSNYAHAVNGPP